jgi:hypothetical protein
MLPLRFDNPPGSLAAIPNLVRRSVRADNTIPAPGISSFASAVNSTTDVSANGRFITLARWNKHYLIPRDPALYGGANANKVGTDPDPSFVAPDWVILTRNGEVAFSAWDPTLADQTPTNNSYAVGRFAYAIYDEGQLLDMNVAGYPSGTTADQAGRKGPVAFADLTVLPYPILNPDASAIYQSDALVGWRNYGSTQPTNNFPNTNFAANFRAGSAPALAYWKSVINNAPGFTSARSNPSPAPYPWNGRTDQMFLSRQQLIAYRTATGLPQDALQYFTTFSRELNAPSWKPSTPSAINPDLLNVRAVGTFTRADGTSAAANDLLINRRFPLSRINGLGPTGIVTTDPDGNPLYSTINNGSPVQATDPNNGGGTISRDFGLHRNGDHWDYVGATGTTVQNTIATLDTVAGQNREPNFFELLKAGILSGSVGLGSSGVTFVAAETKYYSAVAPTSSDYQIMQIGANIIDQWDSDNVPTFINFGGNQLAGVENLPYLNKLVFKPHWKAGPQFEAWLLPSLWNPHQNAASATGNVRVAIASGVVKAFLTDSGTSPLITTTAPIKGNPSTQFMTVAANLFATPSAPTAVVKPPNPPSTISQSNDGYWGFYFPFATTAGVTSSNSLTAYPDFGPLPGCNFELQVQVSSSPAVWKAYQRWTGCGPNNPLVFSAPAGSALWTQPNLQTPEFVTLDPRTVRFGVWGNAGNQTTPPATPYVPVSNTLDLGGNAYETITALYPNGTGFSSPTSPNLYLYANNVDATVHYTDLDTIRRQGDLLTTGMTTAMQPADSVDRPRILNRPFQSLAELGQVFRDQPWKTLDFGDFVSTTVPGADAGLLDVFTLHESANEAGKTSLNTRYKFMLTAILSNATKSLTNTATVITPAERNAIVTALFKITWPPGPDWPPAPAGPPVPIIRKTDLLTQLAADPSIIGPPGLGNKEARELVIRAFSDATQTRTWNFMIDVIAQSGRYPTSAASGPNTTNPLANFLVEGEQHYWVHVAIDRFTGQVVDKQIEVVNE